MIPTPQFTFLTPPAAGTPIRKAQDVLVVPDDPDHSVHRGRRHRARHLAGHACACSTRRWRRRSAGRKRIVWFEVLAGEKADARDGRVAAAATRSRRSSAYKVAIKGPLTTPVGGGIRSLNVALRQVLDLYACVRPVRYFAGTPVAGEAPER